MEIDTELRSLIRPLSEEEYEQLKASVLAEGIRDPLVVWNGILLDGHHRYKIAQEYGLEYRTVEIELPNKEAAKEWIITNQLGRRNLTPMEASYYRGKLYESRKLSRGGDRKSNYQNDSLKDTAKEVSKEYSVSYATVFRDAEFSRAVDKIAKEIGEEAKHAILTGKANIPKKDVEKLIEIKQKAPELVEPILRGEKPLTKAIQDVARIEVSEKIEVPEPPEEPITKPGDLWILGRHRLLCGDATKKEDVERLMDGKKADMVFTDPPHNAAYEGGSKKREMIKNDKIDDFYNFLYDAYANCLEYMKNGSPIYICHSELERVNFTKAFEDVGFKVSSIIIWAKNNSTFSMNKDYKQKHEPIIYGWKQGANHTWVGGTCEDTLWEINRPSKSDLHPTMKPIELVARSLTNSSYKDALVYDPFGGSGSTLIACEQLKRICYMMELDPVYCDVIIKRWENLTGQKAVLAE